MNSANSSKTSLLTVARFVALPVLLAILWAAWQVGTIGLASAWHYQALRYLELWQKNEQLFTETNFQKASIAINNAVNLHPSHPEYLLLKVKISLWGWYQGELKTEQLNNLESLYQQAIALRPIWPNAYADYAYYLGVTQRHATEAFNQLKLAKQYGPYTPEVFMQIVSIGFINWTVLSTEQKAMTLKALQHAVRNSQTTYYHALNATKVTERLFLACNFLKASQANFSEKLNKQIKRDFCK